MNQYFYSIKNPWFKIQALSKVDTAFIHFPALLYFRCKNRVEKQMCAKHEQLSKRVRNKYES